MSSIWKYFTILSDNKNKAKCESCKKGFACPGGTTSGLKNHLKLKHKEIFRKFEAESTKVLKNQSNKRPAENDVETNEPRLKQRTIADCLPQNDDTLDKAITEAIIDFLSDSGVAFRVIGLESFHKLMKVANKRIKLKHPVTYSRMVKVKAEDILREIHEIIAAVKGDLSCLSFTTDLWTSGAGEPFMSLTIHFIDSNWHLFR